MTNEPVSSVRVLLIDDDEDDFIMFRDLLAQVKGQRCKLEWASSYEEGLNKLSFGFDVCFLDFRLGGHTGLELLKVALERGCKTPLILLTGYGEPEVDMEAMKLGAADYLVKDQVTPLLLERSIRYSIHRAKAVQALLDREAQILVQDRLASVGLLASSLAHEIGTPLGVIRGRAEYLELKLRNDPNVKKNVDVIVAQIDRVSRLIRSLLNLARGDKLSVAGKVDLTEVLREVLDLMGHEFRRQEIAIINDLEGAPRVEVRAEPGPLHQVLLNLLVNSLHAIEAAQKAGKRDHSILLSASDAGEFWRFSIKDSGCGISPANLKNLFKPFFTTKDIGKGTGLGLATSYRLVDGWGGKIEVESQEGYGATFSLLLAKCREEKK